ncbi:MAG: hypothetical protein EOQ62_04290 [Mesorhizobium sp.]|uniref:hypothetical protein n=1 Tax=Mesorhizobium sp. TaxID=1871066 RepID=UPI000FE4C984|nr:hypothetical protein [Mesorhizobium sp.]RWG50498.1 MAG: hypothetical protein EOQ62_04290 [Mesorhizobium sp.]RWL05256.1 MAG: hypothetical protein EOR55_13455 [Mesorhizobium sp.]TIN10278.1 MAG: hypothetical protein E5Y14_12200 [Mesorhizobium sp.]TIQ62114.1 MAG: hypothetical protein E5X41_29760 [Mesorhizobium sp.]
MAESAAHARLVRAILSFVELEFGPIIDLSVRDDSVFPLRYERPPRVGGFVPDVYATDVPTTVTIIGEAKTTSDLERERSRSQISAFLAYLAHMPKGVFVLSVPLVAGATARRIVAAAQQSLPLSATRIVILDGIPG